MSFFKTSFLTVLINCSLLSGLLYAEEDQVQQYVLEAYPRWYSGDKASIQGNIGIDATNHDLSRVNYYIKPSGTYALGKNWAFHGGLGFYYKDYKEYDNEYELRPFLGLSHFIQLNDKWSTSAYFRAEERYQYISSDSRGETLRLRLRLRTAYDINTIYQKHTWRSATIGLEGFKSFTDDEGIDIYDHETRLTFGLERNLDDKEKIRFELAFKYFGVPTEISQSNVTTVYFKIQYYPSWGGFWGNTLSNRDIDE